MAGSGQLTGAGLAIRTLAELGVEASFGVPGVHALANWDALRRGGELRHTGGRTELSAAFAADGYARASGRPAALLLSTGPGALISLGGLMEAATSHVPLIAIASQIESSMIGAGRGALHELPDQAASFAPVVKWTGTATSVDSIPRLLAEAHREAVRPPSGPVFLEIPVDVLRAEAADPGPPPPPAEADAAVAADQVERAVAKLEGARAPLIWAGGGAIRAGAAVPLLELSERLDSPVVTTYMGKGAIPETHPLAAGAACDEPPFAELVADSDVVLCVGTELGEEASSAYSIEVPPERMIRVDASSARLAAPGGISVLGDAAAVLEAMLARAPDRRGERNGVARAATTRNHTETHLVGQGREPERELLRAIRRALPEDAIHCWDMTILGYWAARDFPALGPRRFLYPVGSGTLGYAWPAAIGASVAEPWTPVLAVAGDGGFMYSIAELASARQAGVGATLLLVDDGGYGILREYQRATYGETWGVELDGPDLVELASSFGVAAAETSGEALQGDLEGAIEQPGPSVLVLRETLRPPTTMD